MSKKAIIDEVLKRIKSLVVNQARYQIATSFIEMCGLDADEMYEKAEQLSDDATKRFLIGTELLDTANLLRLVKKIGVRELYDGEDWLDDVADYIVKHKTSCYALWHYIDARRLPYDS